MSQTTNLGLPLWGETPPGNPTGKDLRNAIIGENEDSMAQILDAKVERLKNKVEEITDEPTGDQYPSVQAVKDYVGKVTEHLASEIEWIEF